jgi:hypothetical protein
VQEVGRETEIRAARGNGTRERVVARFTSKGGFTQVATLFWSPDGRRLLIEPYRHVGD